MQFEWDDEKRAANLQKHRIDFSDAAEMFAKPVFIVEDKRRNYSEKRFQGMGIVNGRVLVAVFTHRANAIRLISLRKANIREQKFFFKAFEDGLEMGRSPQG